MPIVYDQPGLARRSLFGSGVDIPREPPKKRRRYVIYAAVGTVVLVGATLGLRKLRAAAPTVERATVWMDTVKRGPMLRQVQGQGTLVPEQIRWISATAASRVERIIVRPGTPVKEDTVLVELTNPDQQLAALEAERQVTSAEAELVNLQATQQNQRLAQESVVATLRSELGDARRRATADDELAKKGFLSELERGQSRDRANELAGRLEFEQKRLGALSQGMAAQVAAQRSQVERLRAIAQFRRREVDALRVRAGVAGMLQELPLQVGQSVAVGALLAKVAQPDKLKAEVHIPETQAKDVQLGQRATVDTRNGVIPGRVSRIDPAVQAGTVKIDVTLEGALPQGARPDLTIEGTVELERLENVLFVGRPAFGQAQSTVGLFKLEDGGDGAVRVNVKLGKSSVKTVEILSGLAEGDQVILSDMSQWDSADRIRLR
ncbi:MAG TPA: HlyD family efflux transporter periplasmic adaptor subunit [Polyangia bacterium]|nr:HlyD family efflux transporter periplasmic adaptor subunit [Polyangia bacterium]